jgi:hypothetical protein
MGKRITVLLASLLVTGGVLAQDQQAIRDQFFGETDAIKAQADALNAAMLAPESYADGMQRYEHAGDTLVRGRDLDRVREDLAEANTHFTRAVQAATLAQTTFAGALAAREAAQTAEAAQYAERDWARAEDGLVDAARVLEDGNLRRATDMIALVEERYRDTEADAINERAKANAR